MNLKTNLDVLYLTENLDNYKSSEYQLDFLNNLKNHFNIYEYGPGYKYFDKKKNLSDLENDAQKKFNLIFLGHSFLSDRSDFKLSMNNILINIQKMPKVMFLNKEYVNLRKKLKFIEENNVNLIFSHHHLALYLNKFYNKKFIFLPFATTFNSFEKKSDKKYDLSFIGILKNLNKKYNHTDIREEIRDTLFFSFKNINLLKRKKFSSFNFFWTNHPRNRFEGILSKIFFKKWLTKRDYQNIISSSKVTFNTPSPYDIIGPRYYDSLACGTPILCPKKKFYEFYFDETDLIQFENKEDFFVKFKYLLNNKNYLEDLSKNLKMKYKDVNYKKRVEKIHYHISNKL